MTLKKIVIRVLSVALLLFVAFVAFVIYYFNFVVTGPRGETPFEVAHQRAVKTFVDGRGFGIHRFREKEYFHEYSVVIDGETWRLQGLFLIGASKEYGERFFNEGGDPSIDYKNFRHGRSMPLKRDLGEASHRPLNEEESQAIAELRIRKREHVTLAGPEPEERSEFVYRRVLAPILAENDCLKCHEVKKGEVLGAFYYYLSREKAEMSLDSREDDTAAHQD